MDGVVMGCLSGYEQISLQKEYPFLDLFCTSYEGEENDRESKMNDCRHKSEMFRQSSNLRGCVAAKLRPSRDP
jgi:hypothetical protein